MGALTKYMTTLIFDVLSRGGAWFLRKTNPGDVKLTEDFKGGRNKGLYSMRSNNLFLILAQITTETLCNEPCCALSVAQKSLLGTSK